MRKKMAKAKDEKRYRFAQRGFMQIAPVKTRDFVWVKPTRLEKGE
jgi:hypothetical protein